LPKSSVGQKARGGLVNVTNTGRVVSMNRVADFHTPGKRGAFSILGVNEGLRATTNSLK